MDNKEMLMKIVSEVSVFAPDGARLEISENEGKFVIELSPKSAADNKTKDNDDSPTEIDADGTKLWKNKKGEYHREGDLPAVIWPDGSQFWYKNDLKHREGDKPAAIYADGSQRWHKNGQLHRDGDLPAAIYADDVKYWLKKDKLHREGNKPAVITKTQYEYWVDGKHVMTIKHKDGVVEV